MVDLANNKPGELTFIKAEEELAKMKAKSKIGTFFARLFNVHTDERSWRIGAQGEKFVGQKLDTLRKDGYQVLHSVPIGSKESDVDHLIIGPTGVFTINTKNHPGKSIWVGGSVLLVNGAKVPYVRNSTFEADRAARMLSAACGFPVFASGVIVFTSGTSRSKMTIKSQPHDRTPPVHIASAFDVVKYIKNSPVILSLEQVENICTAARNSETWKVTPKKQRKR